ncbi:MAG: hypothetical protein MdMp024_1881 [Bacteroidales bacterium]|jgi:hypothetical protein
MEKKLVMMSEAEYKRFLAFKEADKAVRSIKRGLKEIKEAREGKRTLKSAYQLVNEL